MKHIKVLELSEADRLKLEKGYHNGPTHNYRFRCKSILLKSSGKSASEIAEIFDVTVPTVYAWINYLQTFFRSIGARYKRIRKRPRVAPHRNSIHVRKRSCKNLKALIPKVK